jgi:hypothetical protein
MVLSWDTITKFNISSPPTYSLGRSSEIQDKYDIHREWIKSSNIDIKKYIYDKFNLIKNGIIFIENEFPYNCEEGIKHYVIWISERYPYSIEKLDNFIKNSLNVKDTGTEYVFYKNIPKNNSISSVNHYHVFAKFKK